MDRQHRHAHDKQVFQTLLDRHDRLRREVILDERGMRAITRSDDPELVALLHDHVPAMHRRLQEGFALRRWDPLYNAIFEHADQIHMQITLLADGVEVIETGDTPHVVALLHAHAKAVDGFVARGREVAGYATEVPA
ncbi:MAG: hypothetical protein H6981_15240 [Gammaproteobacteria bacterium]|nr:hypothetical protein [Gammaproteobacteria bacterium]MCP5138140.1 hypothetical protein [Gammaproteobacteria bacterium]